VHDEELDAVDSFIPPEEQVSRAINSNFHGPFITVLLARVPIPVSVRRLHKSDGFIVPFGRDPDPHIHAKR